MYAGLISHIIAEFTYYSRIFVESFGLSTYKNMPSGIKTIFQYFLLFNLDCLFFLSPHSLIEWTNQGLARKTEAALCVLHIKRLSEN